MPDQTIRSKRVGHMHARPKHSKACALAAPPVNTGGACSCWGIPLPCMADVKVDHLHAWVSGQFTTCWPLLCSLSSCWGIFCQAQQTSYKVAYHMGETCHLHLWGGVSIVLGALP